mgnify:CR=1 FL=1
MLQRLLLLPLLSPLLAVLLVAAVNPRPWVSVRILTWSSPTWPLGGWIATAAALGAALSSAGAALALQGQVSSEIPERQVRRRSSERERPDEQQQSAWGNWRQPERSAPSTSSEGNWAGPSRNPQDPAPTVSVPFRVIRQGTAAARAKGTAQPDPTAKRPAAASTNTGATDPAGFNNADWDSPISDDW